MDWQVDSEVEEAAWQENHLRDVISALKLRPSLPNKHSLLGFVEVSWEEIDPGVAFVHSIGGTPADRRLAESVIAAKLAAHGYERATFTFDERETSNTRLADWSDIEAKAKRLIQSGNVQILRNGYNNVIGHVVGDHGEYQTEIGRDDPETRAITTWQCDCPWDQFAWGRTRKWKKYEGRPCAHVLATFWKAQATPLDEDAGGQPPTPGQRAPLPGPTPPPGPPLGPGPAPAAPGLPPMQPPGVLPPSPTEQLQMMQPAVPGSTPAGMPAPPNSVSVPGARQPSPANPVQFPSTYSGWHFSKDFQNGDMVRLEEAEWGTAEGKSEAHGAGQPREIPANSIGEVLGQDPTTGWVDVIFPGPQANAGPLEPYHIRAWIFPQKLTPMPGVQKPGPAVRRR